MSRGKIAWFDMSRSYNPAIHRTKQALFHAAIATDLDNDPLPPPHPELTRYFKTPDGVLEKSKKYLDKLKKAADVKIGSSLRRTRSMLASLISSRSST